MDFRDLMSRSDMRDNLTKPFHTRDWLYEHYWRKQMSLKEIAQILDVRDSLILYWMKKMGIPRRTRVESIKLAKEKISHSLRHYFRDPENRKKWGVKIKKILQSPAIRKKIRHHKGEEIQIPPPNSPMLSYVLGVLLGDGSVYYHKRAGTYVICLKAKEKKFVESFRKALLQIGLYPSKLYFDKTCWSTRAYCLPFFSWYKSLRLNQIYNMVVEHPIEFLRGFYESEGSLNKKTGRVTIYNTNEILLKIVAKLIKQLGFDIGWYKYKYSNRFIYSLYIRGGKKQTLHFINLLKPCIKGVEVRRS